MGASYSKMDVEVGGDTNLIALGINNKSEIASVFASYPLERTANRNTYLTSSLENKHYQNNASLTKSIGDALNSDRVINALNLGASGDLFGSWGGKLGWGVNLALAHNDLSGNKKYRDDFDKPAANTQGNFTKLNANVNHIVPIAQDWYLYTALSAQWADKNLDTAEKFQLGGPFGVRAYPVGEGLGDHGWLATAEVRHNVGETQLGNVEVFGFADTGGVTQFVTPYSNAFLGKPNAPNSYELSGVGLGVGVTYKDTGNLRVMVAEKVGSNPNPSIYNTDADGRKDNTRVWVVGTIVF
jgi:hemolysin activation/secretion protein